MRTLVSKWEDLPADNPVEGLTRRKVSGELALVAHVSLSAGCVVPVHSHPNEQIAVILEGRVRWTLGEERIEVEGVAGEVFHMPANEPHGLVALDDNMILDVFCPPGPMGVDQLANG